MKNCKYVTINRKRYCNKDWNLLPNSYDKQRLLDFTAHELLHFPYCILISFAAQQDSSNTLQTPPNTR